jgi:hypothetical protein
VDVKVRITTPARERTAVIRTIV